MRLRHLFLFLAATFTVWSASTGLAQAPDTAENQETPVFKVRVVADFATRVQSYYELRSKLEQGLPALTVTDRPAEIRRAQSALARRIRVARRRAKQGEIFTPVVSIELKRLLRPEINEGTREAIMDDNPGAFSHHINGSYPEGKPFSTVPAGILAALPSLPDDLQYRFLGPDLILLDTRANVILDRIACAIPCTER